MELIGQDNSLGANMITELNSTVEIVKMQVTSNLTTIKQAPAEIKHIFEETLSKGLNEVQLQALTLVIDTAFRKALSQNDSLLAAGKTLADCIMMIEEKTKNLIVLEPSLTANKRDQISKVSADQVALLTLFLNEYREDVNRPITQVFYAAEDAKESFDILNSNSHQKLKQIVNEFECKFDAIRIINDDYFAIDYEQYGYFIARKENATFLNELLDKQKKLDELSRSMSFIAKNSEPEIWFIWSKLCQFLFEDVSKELAEDIAMLGPQLVQLSIDNVRTGHYSASKLTTLITEDVRYPKLTLEIVRDLIRSMKDSESVTQIADSLRQRYSCSLPEFDMTFDVVDEVLDFENESNVFMAKLKSKQMNAFESAALSLRKG